ncbi:MAG: FAD-binding protein [Planctomycetota bacterium]
MTASNPGTPTASFLQRTVGMPLEDFVNQPVDRRAEGAREALADLHDLFDESRPFAERDEPERTRELAQSLLDALERGGSDARKQRMARIVTDGLLRSECDRDQNVYLGRLFTRQMTQAVPDLVFLPVDDQELATALLWAREQDVPVTLRGAATTAMGGAIPGSAGLVLDFSRLDRVEIDAEERCARFGAGIRMRPLHAELHEAGFALPVYPSNLGGTFAGWLATGGIGMNAYGRGRAADAVRWVELMLPTGDIVKVHRDGKVDPSVPGTETMTLDDIAGSEGQLGAIVRIEVDLDRLPELSPFLLCFPTRESAIEAVEWLELKVRSGLDAPGDVKLLSASHLEHVRHVWKEEDARLWKQQPGGCSSEEGLPWKRILSPRELGVPSQNGSALAGGTYLFLSFLSAEAGRRFAGDLSGCPGTPQLLAEEGVRFAADRFRPQQIKRLGPGLLASEIVMPTNRVAAFLPAAEKLAKNVGNELDAEIYYLSDGTAMVLAGYLTDHRRGAFQVDLLLAPALLDLAMSRFGGRPYVLGRWQAVFFRRKFPHDQAERLRILKRAFDPDRVVNRGAFFDMGLQGLMGSFVMHTMAPGVKFLRLLATLVPPFGRVARGIADRFDGPAAGRGESADETPLTPGEAPADGAATARALHCVNCGECNSVCPIFHESGVRLPQMLTHLGEANHAGEDVDASGSTLLDLCMRCGNCEEVCQAGIPHLPLYGVLQERSDENRPRDRSRHVLLLEWLRSSERYSKRFLGTRDGGYLKRAQAALPGSARYLLLRAEGEAGPAATCIHCGACVDVCPTHANREYEGEDPRWITTDQERCIGCGTCVEVCPANVANGGQTLRVMEAPTLDWFAAMKEFEMTEGDR